MKYNLSYIKKNSDQHEITDCLSKKYLSDKHIKCNCYKNAYVLPLNTNLKGGILDINRQEIKASPIQQIKGSYSFKTEDIHHKKSAILLAIFTTYTWGHCFTDHFSKLWFVGSEQYENLKNNGADIIYISYNNKKPPTYVVDLFKLAGVDLNSAICVEDITQYEYLYIPDDSFFSGIEKEPRFYTKEYIETIHRVKEYIYSESENIRIDIHPKVYLTRTQGKNFSSMYRDLGEKAIADVFSNIGYKIIAPEKLQVKEQIWLLMNCKSLAATEGSIAHTAIFCSEDTELSLIRKCNWISKHQLVANELANLNVTYIDAHKSYFCDKKEPWHGPFFVCITKELENYIGYKLWHIPYYFSFNFYLYCARAIYVRTFRKINFIDRFIRKLLR